jgi:hypothetical protein
MKFIHLTIENFGPFKGVQNVPLGCKAEKSINVICGTYGAGKTFFLRSIVWALGLRDPDTTKRPYYGQLVHKGASSASVKLKFTFGDKHYEVSRRLFEVKNGQKQVEVELRAQSTLNANWELIREPEQYLKALFPLKVSDAIFDFECERFAHVFQDQPQNPFNLPGFGDWIMQLTDDSSHNIFGRYQEQLVPILRLLVSGKAPNCGAGETAVAALHIPALLREWLLTSDYLPAEFQSLRGESLPWLLESPFNMLNKWHCSIASELFVRSASQVVLATTPISLQPPVDITISPRVFSIAAIQLGYHPNNQNATEYFFGRSLCMTRNDNTDFSEIV